MPDDSCSSPEFGKIYYIRQSVRRTFQLLLNPSESEFTTFSSASSSTSSNTSSNKKEKNNPNKRPCLCWDINNGIITVLLMTSFDGVNPLGKTNNDAPMIPTISNEDLLKHLVSIDPTPPITGRRTHQLQKNCSSDKLTEHELNSFLILIPVVAKSKTNWSRLFDGTFSADSLTYINGLLTEKKEEMILNFSRKTNIESCSTDSTIPKPRTWNIDTIKNDQTVSDDSDSDTSEGSGSLFICRMNMVDDDMVRNWLHLCIDNNLDDWSIENMATIDDDFVLAQSSKIMDNEKK